MQPSLLDEIYPGLEPDDFFSSANAAIFREITCRHNSGEPIHIEALNLQKHLGDDWWHRAGEMMESVGATSHVTTYAKIVRENATLRRLRDVGENLINVTHKIAMTHQKRF